MGTLAIINFISIGLYAAGITGSSALLLTSSCFASFQPSALGAVWELARLFSTSPVAIGPNEHGVLYGVGVAILAGWRLACCLKSPYVT